MLFHRDLPGGGFVAIQLEQPDSGASVARVVVERRGDRARRSGHNPPVIVERPWGDSATASSDDFGELYRLANDNVSIARGLMTLRRAD